MADWADLNQDILISIVERLPSMESYESFGKVCKSWEVAARKGHLNQTIFEGPWLMFADKEDEEESREFSSVTLDINRTRKIFLPEANKQRCVSCKDWLVISSPDEIQASLLHPLSGVHIHLPKLDTLLTYHPSRVSHYINKAVISANPAATNSDYIVVICTLGGDLGFWKSGDTAWTSMDCDDKVDDIIYSVNNNKLYCINEHGNIFSCDIHGPNPTQLLKVSGNVPHEETWCDRAYLVELSGGKFLLVRKYLFHNGIQFYRTERFRIFEVNIDDGTWVEVNDLENRALFLGYNTSYFVECSEYNKCKPNCIYFSDDFCDGYLIEGSNGGFGGGKDMGIYCVSDGSIQPLYDDKIGRSVITPPTWIGPSF